MAGSSLDRWRVRCARLRSILVAFLQDPRQTWRIIRNIPAMRRGRAFAPRWNDSAPAATRQSAQPNPFMDYAIALGQGATIWKWVHYFDIYQRYLGRFIGQPVCLVEVGVFRGGSLDMWAQCLGKQSRIYGVDIDPECEHYSHDNIAITIGDQQDRGFWQTFKAQTPVVDILIDDGGHQAEQQIVTLEEMLPHLRPGGVYLCEDIHCKGNAFVDYAAGLIHQLNHFHQMRDARTTTSAATPFQKSVYSIHFYPYVLVIEKQIVPASGFFSVRFGSEPSPPGSGHQGS